VTSTRSTGDPERIEVVPVDPSTRCWSGRCYKIGAPYTERASRRLSWVTSGGKPQVREQPGGGGSIPHGRARPARRWGPAAGRTEAIVMGLTPFPTRRDPAAMNRDARAGPPWKRCRRLLTTATGAPAGRRAGGLHTSRWATRTRAGTVGERGWSSMPALRQGLPSTVRAHASGRYALTDIARCSGATFQIPLAACVESQDERAGGRPGW